MNAFEARSLAAGISAAALALLVASSARADRAALPLREMVVPSSHVVIGVVKEAAPGREPGAVSMLVSVEETLAGPPLSTFLLRHSPRNPEAPPASNPGTRLLAFLRVTAASGAVVLEPIGGEQGVVPLSDGNTGFVRELVKRAIAGKGDLALADVFDLLEKGDAPPALLGALLADLSRRSSREDGALVDRLACGSPSALPAVQAWAIGRVGALRVQEARPCLEALVRDPRDPERATLAAYALGDLGDRESLRVLHAVLEGVRGEPLAPMRGDTVTPPGTGPADDPEDESDPTPDPEEGGRPRAVLGPRAIPPATADVGDRDGEVEPDGASEDGAADALSLAAVLAVGKLGDSAAVPELARVAMVGGDFTLHSTVVHALGLIGGAEAIDALEKISRTHPDALIRVQARETLARLVGAAGGVR